MEQPTLLSAANNGGGGGSGSGSSISDTTRSKQQQQRPPPTPEELLALYESQGLDSREASIKAVGDLQAVLYRTIVSARKKNTTDTARKLDNLNTRLAIIDTKLDAKPGYPESLAIGVASGAALHAAPHLIGAFRNIWNVITGNLDSTPSSS